MVERINIFVYILEGNDCKRFKHHIIYFESSLISKYHCKIFWYLQAKQNNFKGNLEIALGLYLPTYLVCSVNCSVQS